MTELDNVAGQKNLFVRFIDRVEAIFLKVVAAAPAVEKVAVALEPVLALTPAGPEYQVAVNAIISAQQIAQASLAAGTTLSGEQKAQIAVSAATPALLTILASKGLSTGTQEIIKTWIQNVFNILAGPAVPSVATATK